MNPTRTCSACAMEIDARATKCPHCLTRQDNAVMHRDLPGRKIAGVCVAVAQQLGVDAVLVRVAFVVAAVLSGGITAGIYLLLWIATPNALGEQAPLSRLLDWVDGLTSSKGRPVPESPQRTDL